MDSGGESSRKDADTTQIPSIREPAENADSPPKSKPKKKSNTRIVLWTWLVNVVEAHIIGKGSGRSVAKEHVAAQISIAALFKKFWRVANSFFWGDSMWKARGLFILVIISCGAHAALYLVLSYTQRDFSTALSKKDVGGFHSAIRGFVGIVVVAAPFFAFEDYLQNVFVLEWRIWLTKNLLDKYFANQAYFDVKMEGKLDNPDQRISSDVASFVNSTVSIITLLIGKLLLLGGFGSVLWSVSPGLVYFLFGYAFFGTLTIVWIFGRKLMHLRFEGLQREADFRYSLVRIRENSESIAFYRGDTREAAITKGVFDVLVENIRERILWARHLSIFNNFYNYATIVIPSLIIAPRYFKGEVEFGVITQAGIAFRTILDAMTIIVTRFPELSGLAAETERLDSLIRSLEQHEAPQPPPKRVEGAARDSSSGSAEEETDDLAAVEMRPLIASSSSVDVDSVAPVADVIQRSTGTGLVLADLSLRTPDGRVQIFRHLSLNVLPGQSLLIMGSSGCGKSSLLRAIAGLWSSGSGCITTPPVADTFFLPQKPYMPLGSLRDQLMFPDSSPKEKDEAADAELLTLLDDVSLRDLPERVGGLDSVCDWSDVLSTGEQQRMAFARLLLQTPKLAFLDEATSALDSKNEAMLYSLLHKRVGSYVSVGHRLSLVPYHTTVLEFIGDETWTIQSANEFSAAKGL